MLKHDRAPAAYLLACAVAALPRIAFASPDSLGADDQAHVEKGMRDQWRRAAETPDLTDLVINWRNESSYVPLAQPLDELRALVREDPAHPRARELAEFERRLTEGTPLVRQFSFRTRGVDRWRLCQNAGDRGEVEFIDYVMTDQLAWKLTPTWLVLIDPSKPMPDGHPIRDVGAFFTHDLFMLLDGGLRNSALLGAELQSITADEDGWRCEAADAAGEVQREFHVRWDARAGRAFVDRVLVTRGFQQGYRWELHDWALQPETDLWIAGRAEKYAVDNQLEYVLTLERVRREPPERFEQLVTAPDFNVPDALRGQLAFKSITDYRGEHPVDVIQTSRGIETIPLARVEEVSKQGEQDYRRLGWGLAGLAVVALVFLRLLRGRGAAASLPTH